MIAASEDMSQETDFRKLFVCPEERQRRAQIRQSSWDSTWEEKQSRDVAPSTTEHERFRDETGRLAAESGFSVTRLTADQEERRRDSSTVVRRMNSCVYGIRKRGHEAAGAHDAQWSQKDEKGEGSTD